VTNAVIISEDQAVKHETSNSTGELGEKLRQDRLSEDLKLQKLQNKRLEQDTKYRKVLARWVIFTVSIWLLFVIGALTFNNKCDIGISDTVACVLLGTTTLNILGLAYIVLKGLFPDSTKAAGN